MNDLFASNSIIFTSVQDLYYALEMFRELRRFDVVYIAVNDSTKSILNGENLILIKRLCKERGWTVLFYFDNLIDASLKKNIDIVFNEEFMNRICPLRYGFLAVYSEKLDRKDSIFAHIDNVYHVDDIISTIYDHVIDMLIIDFNHGTDFEKINYLQKKIVYMTKDYNVFERNFRYKNVKKISLREEGKGK